jgi:ribosome-associated toxin RatA of RatAB toxin-antitoxin module
MPVPLFLMPLTIALAADPSTPHPQQLLKPVDRLPKALSLTAEEQARLDRGQVISRSQRTEEGGSGQAVQLVNATASSVWKVILDYDQYPARVDSVVSAKVYERQGEVFFVDMKSSIVGISTVLYSRNRVTHESPTLGWLAWSLDYRRTSDVKDIAGYWRVEQLQDNPPLTRIEQGTELAISNVPGFVVGYLTKQSLVDGLAWVKQAVESP